MPDRPQLLSSAKDYQPTTTTTTVAPTALALANNYHQRINIQQGSSRLPFRFRSINIIKLYSGVCNVYIAFFFFHFWNYLLPLCYKNRCMPTVGHIIAIRIICTPVNRPNESTLMSKHTRIKHWGIAVNTLCHNDCREYVYWLVFLFGQHHRCSTLRKKKKKKNHL